MLQTIHDTVAGYAAIVARVTGADVEVTDARLVRVAGTGRYATGIGESIRHEGEVYRHVMRIRRTFVLDTPRGHHVCTRCAGRDTCAETFSISTPILDGDTMYGVMGLLAFTEDDGKRLSAQRDMYVAFLEQCAEFIVHKVRDRIQLDRSQRFLDLMLRVLDINTRGLILFNEQGGVSYMNDVARRELDAPPGPVPPADLTLRRTGESFADLEEFVVGLGGRTLTLMGQLVDLGLHDPFFASVFSFESLPRMAHRAASFGGGESPGLDNLLGHSDAMLELKEQITRIASSPSTVLITGESGTGKEMAARAIHASGDRRDKPFIGVNCGAIPDTLLESELFGYTGGAFTGASSKGRIGKFELANKGVLFLDEITTLPLYLQVKLLRALQERTFTRLGSNRLIEVDIRIIAASNEDLAECVQQGRFREDLYYRLNVIPLHMPPLRERGDDIELLARAFLGKYARLFGKPEPRPDPGFLAALKVHTWPGNVREFENTMEFMVNMMRDEGPLRADMLPPAVKNALRRPAPAGTSGVAGGVGTGGQPGDIAPVIRPLCHVEQEAILAAVRHFGDDGAGKRAAAAALGIGVATLYRKLSENRP